MILLLILRKPVSFVRAQDVTQQVTTGSFEAHSHSKPAFMAMDGDKPH